MCYVIGGSLITDSMLSLVVMELNIILYVKLDGSVIDC